MAKLSIVRRRRGKGFVYIGVSGKIIRDKRRLSAIKKLAVPPAWAGVRMTSDPKAKILAKGRDGRGRLQYVYNPSYRARREAKKFRDIAEFGLGLPKLRARIAHDVANASDLRFCAACCARLIDKAGLRPGSSSYRRENGSYGATTLLKSHVTIDGDTVSLRFIGKGGAKIDATFTDALLSEGLGSLLKTPGRDLFRYRHGRRWVSLDISALNTYLRERSGRRISAKMFRTWKATRMVAEKLAKRGSGQPLKPALEAAAEVLGNTPTMVRSAYLHPAIVDAHKTGALQKTWIRTRGRPNLPRGERAVLKLIGDQS